ncbi:MAG: response regulator [Bacteroidetes bacterium]|nr:response regulator [Bacteroidota bacterium]
MDEKNISGTVLNVLSLEDSAEDFEIIREQLVNAGYNLTISRVEKESEFVGCLYNHKYDIILADFHLPGFDAFGALRLRNEIRQDVPFICISGAIGEETAIDLIKQGAADYILKDRPKRLPLAIDKALEKAKEKELKRQANENLRLSEKKYRDLVEYAIIGIYTTNLQGKLLFANNAMCKMMEYDSIDEFINADITLTYKNKEEREKFIEIIRKTKQILNYELELVTKKGNAINVIINSFISGEVLTGMMMDISDRKHAEDTVKNKMTELQQFHNLTVGRELSMIELKKEVNELLKKSGQAEKYRIAE